MISASAICQTIPWHHPALPILMSRIAVRYVYPTPLHYHKNVLELHIIRSGEGKYLIDRQLFPFQSYAALVIQPMRQHRHFLEPGRWIQQVTIMLDRILLAGRPADTVSRKLPGWIKLSSMDINILEMRCRLIENEISRPADNSRRVLQNELENIVLLLQRASKEKDIKPVSDSRLLKIINFIETNYARKTSLRELAVMAMMSPTYLSHRFKRQTGISLKHYILQRRIAAAKVYLESETDIKMTVLAEQLGFSDLSSFFRCFKSYVGIPPSAYGKISHKQRNICQ